MSIGYYSLIQYCPDVGRLEAVNIGLILYSADPALARVRTVNGYRRARTVFGRATVSPRHFERLCAGVEARFRAAAKSFAGVADLKQFIAREANDLLITPPRPVAIESPARTMDELFDKLVESKSPPVVRYRGVRGRLEAEFSKPEFEGRIAREIPVQLPLIGSSIKVPFGYQNGKFNLIQTATFRDEGPVSLLNSAGRFKLEGKLIHEANQELIVVGEFPRDDHELEGSVRRLIGDQATLYTADDLEKLFDTIRKNAKPLPVDRV
ncbi:DUF3037 domain-containing protein [Gemmata sp.]|uniref:DUF3037 domain-containing protein n=1 Tax=Gemmata sp. TaxID=1914242 RepID=UPI003F6EDBCA